MRLALTTWRVDVDAMLEGMSSAQFEEWRRFDRMHPIGDLRNEIEGARLIRFLSRMMGNESEDLGDFLWSWAPKTVSSGKSAAIRQTEKEILSAFGIK